MSTELANIEEIPELTAENWLDELSHAEQLFALEYLKSYNLLDACRAGGFADTMAQSKAYDWVSKSSKAKPHLSRAIHFARDMLTQAELIDTRLVVRQLKAIATADPRKVMDWRAERITSADEDPNSPDGVVTVREVVSNTITLKSSDEIDDETAAAISEVSQDQHGNVRIKFHPKVPALQMLARHLGMEAGDLGVRLKGFDGGAIKSVNVQMTAKEAAEAWRQIADDSE